MKYSFSASFLKIQPPATNFGDAWELLCHELLRRHHAEEEIVRLLPPDHGVDLLRRSASCAYQCKSDERGNTGTLAPGTTIESLERAMPQKIVLAWETYALATNAFYSGDGVIKIVEAAERLGLAKDKLIFRGPDYWSELCESHFAFVSDRLDYRLSVTESEVREAFQKARYYDKFVSEHMASITRSPMPIEIGNNRTPIKVQVPFSPDLTVKHLLDVSAKILDITLDGQNYPDIGTSAKPSLSITVNRHSKPFSMKAGNLQLRAGDQLELWIKIIYSDKPEEDTTDPSVMRWLMSADYLARKASAAERRETTIRRFESYVQDRIWRAVERLSKGP